MTLKDQEKVGCVCCVVVLGAVTLGIAARPFVSGMGLTAIIATSVSASVSQWNEPDSSFLLLRASGTNNISTNRLWC